ncbi:MAG: FHA domain-containing protein [Brevefilum sp.]|nr:FHA domain-containing protein [Brevefilum sp.]
MGEVVCTVIYPEAQRRDLVLPDNVPVHLLVNALASALGMPKNHDIFYELQVEEGGELRRIPESRTLQQAFIYNGAILRFSPEKETPGNRAVLSGKNSVRFRLRENTIIGRLTREVHVDIDLVPLDVNKVVSRRHAVITRLSFHYLIKDAGSHNGTFVNQIRVREGESVALHTGDEVCFGTLEKGVILKFLTL